MKHIKLFLIIYTFSIAVGANTNPILLDYFEKIYLEERNNFLSCIENEGLSKKDQIYSDCRISEELKDAAFIIHNKKAISSYDFLSHISTYKPIKKVRPIYPSKMQQESEMGYLIVKFDIDKNGKTINYQILERQCGNVYNPRTEFISCDGFDRATLTAVKKLKYEPTQINNEPVVHRDVLHRFTFLMAQEKNVLLDSGANQYNKLIAAMKRNEFERALKIANENLEKDDYFLYQKAVIKFYMKDYKESVELFNKFSNEVTLNKKEINDEYHVTSFSMLIAALFNLGQYQEIVDLEKNYKIYAKERSEYANLLTMTNFYIGAAFINSGVIPKGAFYMTLASRNASSKAQSDYFDSFIDRISNYL